jgi:hypothetical protein
VNCAVGAVAFFAAKCLHNIVCLDVFRSFYSCPINEDMDMKDKSNENYAYELHAALKQKDFIRAGKYLNLIHQEMPERFDSIVRLLGLGLRKAYYLIRIDEQFADLNVDSDRLVAVGWTKLQMIAPYVTKDTCEDLLLHAERYTARDLALKLKDKKIVSGVRSVLLYLSPAQYEIFSAALLANGAVRQKGGLRGKEKALIHALKSLIE